MFRVSSAHPQKDTVVHMQHMVLSLSMRVPGGLSVHSLSENCTDYYLFIKYYSPLHVSSIKCSSSGGYSCIHAAYGTVTLYVACRYTAWVRTDWRGKVVGGCLKTHREWQYHMLHVYNCILLKMSTWGSKPVEENSILWINNDQCIKLVINIYSYKYQISWKSIQGERSCSVRTDGQTWRSY